MKLCPSCRRTFPTDATACPDHGDTLRDDPLLGATLGSYRIDGYIAEGGLGVVYLGEQTQIRRPVAIKVIRRELVTDQAVGARFLQEARVVAGISHPHLIDIFDLGTTTDGRVYYVMELLSGRTLGEHMKSPLPFSESVRIIDDVLSALEVAHAAGIVHRDLKPDNLFLVERPGEPPFVKVLDFGIAKVLGADEAMANRLTRTGNILGTPQYIAPEQIEGTPTDHRADIYALGVILYELATGTLPFRAPTLGGMLKAHLLETPPPFSAAKLSPGVPPSLEAVVRKALSKEPAQRYASARELREDLGRVISGADTIADASLLSTQQHRALVAPTLQTAPRQPPRALLWGLGAVVLGLGAVALVTTRGQKTPPAPTVTAQPKKARKGPDVAALRSRALAVITAGLKDGDPEVRRRALAALEASKDPRHAGLVEPLLDDADVAVRGAGASTLAALGAQGSMAALRRMVGAPPRLDLAAAEALLRLGDADIARDLAVELARGDADSKLRAALALGPRSREAARLLDQAQRRLPAGDARRVSILARLAAQDGKARAALAAELDGPSPEVQLLVAQSLLRIGDERGRQRLGALARTSEPELSLLAYRALAGFDDQTGFDVFRARFGNPSAHVDERVVAAEGLGASGERSVLEPLGAALGDADPALRLAAAGAILAILGADPRAAASRSLEWASSALGNSSWLVRAQAASVLADSDATQALPLLGRAIRDARPEVRKVAAHSLGRTKAPAAVPLLDGALADATGEVRMTALRSLGTIGDKSAQPVLQRHLARATPQEKVVAAGQLVRLGDDSHVDELKQALADKDPEVRKLAVEESAAKPELAASAAAHALTDKDPGVRLAAALQAAERDDAAERKRAVPILQDALKHGGAAAAVAAFAALQKMGVKPATALAPDAIFASPDVEVRLQAVAAANRLGAGDALAVYNRALEDDDARVRLAALEGIGDHATLDGARRLALLKRLTGDGDAAVRAKAAALYAKLAPPAPPADEDEAATPPPADLAVAADLAHAPDLAGDADAGAARDLGAPDLAPAAPSPATAAAQALEAQKREAEKREAEKEEAHSAMIQGELALKAGRLDAAIKELQRAHKLNAKLQVYFSLGECYRKQGDRESDRGRQRDAYARAIEQYQKSTDKRAASYIKELQEQIQQLK